MGDPRIHPELSSTTITEEELNSEEALAALPPPVTIEDIVAEIKQEEDQIDENKEEENKEEENKEEETKRKKQRD